MGKFSFDRMPVLGAILRIDRQDYRLVEVQPHVRADGTGAVVLRWRTDCPSCGQAFEVTTGMRGTTPVRRCKGCRQPGRPRRVRRSQSRRPLPVSIRER